jgi:tetratricopeptide (TPR) repeat protein
MKAINVRPGYIPYTLSVAILITAASALTREHQLAWALVCLALLAPITVAAGFDRVEFDGELIRHRGPLAFLLTHLFRMRRALSIQDIEAITTEKLRLSIGRSDVRLSYHTRISAPHVEIVVRSHRAAYVPFVKALFRVASSQTLDPRSLDLFRYLETGADLKRASATLSDIDRMPVPLLRRLGNSLRLAGRLTQASSYFRVAYEKEPRNPGLLYEMSRFYYSSAAREDARLVQRSNACLRLASRLAHSEPALLERIGEAFFERLDYKRATDCFRRALELDPARFRSNVGLAEIALRDGKLAHVAHFYNAATATGDAALVRLADREAHYYERLMSDDSFLEAELTRIRISNQIRWARRLSALAFFCAWLSAGIAGRFYSFIEEFGWAVMAASGLLWCAAGLAMRYFRRRAFESQ